VKPRIRGLVRGVGRPRKYDRKAIAEAFEAYIKDTEIPILAEFATQQGVYRSFFHDSDEFSELVAKCTTKKEAALERGALSNKINCTMAIFSLKQLGWSDRLDTTLKGDAAAPIVISSVDANL
jgi:hypothetical protein